MQRSRSTDFGRLHTLSGRTETIQGVEALDLEDAQARLSALDHERAALVRQIAAMRAAAGGPDVTSADGRVALFRSLFRGRSDVFATRWESTKTPGRSGWAPRCANEWRPGTCFKPKVKCAECASRRFVALTSTEIRRHLEGRQTIGIYPLRPDETCWLVAIDLDGASWRDDVAALRESAEDLGMPVLVERSRSGDGAHVWVLFSEAVSARIARSVGSLLLTRAMSRQAIAMSSYDRLFPNQDTMPAGGFGNLIALPLQRQCRSEGCTVFLGEDLEPYPDQWAYLAAVQRLPAPRALEIAAEGSGPAALWACNRHPTMGRGPCPRRASLPCPGRSRSRWPPAFRSRHRAYGLTFVIGLFASPRFPTRCSSSVSVRGSRHTRHLGSSPATNRAEPICCCRADALTASSTNSRDMGSRQEWMTREATALRSRRHSTESCQPTSVPRSLPWPSTKSASSWRRRERERQSSRPR